MQNGEQNGSMRPLRVVVIGAGFAGLSAARALTTKAPEGLVQVTILEASPSVGGRARTGQLPSGTSVELGATWFHGVRDNPVYDVAAWCGIVKDVRGDPEAVKHDIDWQLHFARPMESGLLDGQLNQLAMDAVGRYTEAAEECTQGAQMGDESVGDVLRRTFDEAVRSDNLAGQELQTFADAWHFREKLQRTFDGFYSTDDVSLTFAQEYETLDGPNMPVPGGYQALAHILADGLDIRHSHVVSVIQYGPHGATVRCTNGSTFEADCVLVTVSVGVLQAQHATMFDPPLPDWKVAALGGLRCGVADKMFVEFEIDPSRLAETAPWLATHTAAEPSLERPTSSARSFNTSVSGLPPSPSPQHPAILPSPQHSSLAHAAPNGHHHHPHHLPPPSPPSSANTSTLSPQLDSSAGVHLLHHQISTTLDSCTTGDRASPAHHHTTTPPAANAAAPVSEDSGISAVTGDHHPAVTGPAAVTGAQRRSLDQQGPVSSSMMISEPGGNAAVGSAAERRRRRKHKRAIHSYALLWPVADPALLGAHGHPAARGGFAHHGITPVVCDPGVAPIPMLARLNLPAWILGLHSIRYCPGPEWIKPSLLQESAKQQQLQQHQQLQAEHNGPTASPGYSAAESHHSNGSNSGGGRGKRRLQDGSAAGGSIGDASPGHVSGVLWITGESALAMEAASDEEVATAVAGLFRAFPQLPLPPGAVMPPRVVRTCWGRDPLFQGSYSYVAINGGSGEAVDSLAEPLSNQAGQPIVMFAGEATHRNYIGTVHGAFLTGLREADRILAYYFNVAPMQPATPLHQQLQLGSSPASYSGPLHHHHPVPLPSPLNREGVGSDDESGFGNDYTGLRSWRDPLGVHRPGEQYEM